MLSASMPRSPCALVREQRLRAAALKFFDALLRLLMGDGQKH
jgi:hypothetical protein